MRSYIRVQTKNYTVVFYDGIELIYSFGELVAKGYDSVVYEIKCPSITTRKHINKYLKERGIPYTLNYILDTDDFTFDKRRQTLTFQDKEYFIPYEYLKLINR